MPRWVPWKRVGAHLYIPRHDHDYAFGVGLRMLILRRIVLEEDGLFRRRPSSSKPFATMLMRFRTSTRRGFPSRYGVKLIVVRSDCREWQPGPVVTTSEQRRTAVRLCRIQGFWACSISFAITGKITQGFLALITLPFAFWGVDSYVRNADSGAGVATVGGSTISPAGVAVGTPRTAGPGARPTGWKGRPGHVRNPADASRGARFPDNAKGTCRADAEGPAGGRQRAACPVYCRRAFAAGEREIFQGAL
jgi:hypothetical protein